MKKATFIKDVEGYKSRKLWLVEPEVYYGMDGSTPYLVTSAIDIDPMGQILDNLLGLVGGSCETYIFAADKDGEVVEWIELEGSEKHIKDHEKVLKNAGYEIDNMGYL